MWQEEKDSTEAECRNALSGVKCYICHKKERTATTCPRRKGKGKGKSKGPSWKSQRAGFKPFRKGFSRKRRYTNMTDADEEVKEFGPSKKTYERALERFMSRNKDKTRAPRQISDRRMKTLAAEDQVRLIKKFNAIKSIQEIWLDCSTKKEILENTVDFMRRLKITSKFLSWFCFYLTVLFISLFISRRSNKVPNGTKVPKWSQKVPILLPSPKFLILPSDGAEKGGTYVAVRAQQ